MSEVVQETLVSDEVEAIGSVAKADLALKERIDSAHVAYRKMESLKSKYDEAKGEYDLKKAVLNDIAEDRAAPNESTILRGEASRLTVGKRANKAEVDQKELLQVLGLVSYLELSKVGVTDARKYCVATELKRVLTEERTGARKFTWYEK